MAAGNLISASFLPRALWRLCHYKPGITSILIQARPHHTVNRCCEQPHDKSMSESQPGDRHYLNLLTYRQNGHFLKEAFAFWFSNGYTSHQVRGQSI